MSYKKRQILIIAFLLSILIVPAFKSSYAAQTKKTADIWYRNIKITVNGSQVQLPLEPFIMDDRTYVSVSALSSILNKDISWDSDTSTVAISDKADSNVTALNSVISQKNAEISSLKAQITALKEDLAEAEDDDDDDDDIDDLEDELADDYSSYKEIDFDIYLDGDSDDIEVEIYFDGDDYRDDWDDLSSSTIKSYLQDIVDDILDEFDDADIEGFIEDSDEDETLVEFSADSDGDLSIDYSDDEDDADIDDLEGDLDDDYYDYFNDIDVSIKLTGDEDDITFYVCVDYDEFEDEYGYHKERSY